MRLISRSLLWLAPALMLAAGCGGTTEPDACENVTCGDNAQCAADSGACVCDAGFEGDATAGCTAVVACTDTSCNGHGTCDASSGAVVCTCEEGYTGATCLNCATGFERVDGACVPADACAGLECGDHGSCVVDGDASCECDEGYTGPYCNLCDEGFKAEGELCVPRTACDSMECTDNATCVEADGVASCQCDEGFASEGDECLNEKFVDCNDASPDNATADTAEQVKVTWDADAQAWSAPADCAWSCDTDFFETDEGTCIASRLVPCDDTGDLADGFEFESGVEVEVTYTTADGWTSPAACDTRCKADYTADGEACINTRLVDCVDPQVANADPVLGVQVRQTWTDAGGWSTPAFCDYACKTDFDDLFENGTCIDTAEVDCTTDGTKPDGSEWVEGKKTITFTSAGGWTSSTCAFTCEAGKGPTEAGDCADEQQVLCSDAAPDNAVTTDAEALVTVTWNDVDKTWSTPAVCPWACNDGYDDFEDNGVCINQRTVACVTPVDLPDGAEIIPGDVTITFTDGDWPVAYCDWKCDADHGRVGDECLTEQWVACDGSNPPANQQAVEDDVVITWDADAQAWTAPAACEFECQEGFADYHGTGECADRVEVDCDDSGMPANAEIVGDGKTFIDYENGSWSEPAACDWTCRSGFHVSDEECVEDLKVVACLLDTPPADVVPVGDEAALLALVETQGEPVSALQGKLCYTTSSITAPVDPAALLCVDATYDGSLELSADLVVSTAGVYNYVFVVSVDAGSTWTACDVDGIVEDSVEPGTVTFALSASDQIALVRASSSTDLPLPVNGATVTYVRQKVGNDDAGFFVQAHSEGPALFVKYADTDDVTAGAVVDFTVTAVSSASGGALAATVEALEVIDFADEAAFVQDLTEATDVVTALDDYESEFVSLTGFIGGPFVSAGTDHVSAPLHTDGVQSDSLELRLPATLVDDLFLEEGCLVTVTGPMWRFSGRAQPSAYAAADLDVVCEGLKVTGVEVTSNTTVVLTFNREINTDWLLDVEDHFLVDESLVIESMAVAGNKLTLTTSAQVEGQDYELAIYDLFDLAERGLDEDPTIVNFVGVGAGVCEWAPAVVISQLYGGGGNTGAIFKRDFVELYNRTGADISLDGWSIQRASATGSNWGSTTNSGQFRDLSGYVIKANSFLLVTGDGGSTGDDLVGDVTSGLSLGGTNGKVALVASLTPLTGTNPSPSLWVDLVGYGTTANGYIGAPTANLSNSTAARRTDETVCADPSSNSTDFEVGTPAPRDSSVTLSACVCE